MTNTITSDVNEKNIVEKKETKWVPRNRISFLNFISWCEQTCLKPGELIPEEIWKKYWKKEV